MKNAIFVIILCCLAQVVSGQTTHHLSTSYEDAVAQGWELRSSSLEEAHKRWEYTQDNDFIIPDEFVNANYPRCLGKDGKVIWKDCLKFMYINNQKDVKSGDKFMGLDGHIYYGQPSKLSKLGMCSNLKSIQGRFTEADWEPECDPGGGGSGNTSILDELKELLKPLEVDISRVKGDMMRLERKVDDLATDVANQPPSETIIKETETIREQPIINNYYYGDTTQQAEACKFSMHPYVANNIILRMTPTEDPWMRKINFFVPEVGLIGQSCSWWQVLFRVRLWLAPTQKAIIVDGGCEDCLELTPPEELDNTVQKGKTFLDPSIGFGVSFPLPISSSWLDEISIKGQIYSPNLMRIADHDLPDLNGVQVAVEVRKGPIGIGPFGSYTWSTRTLVGAQGTYHFGQKTTNMKSNNYQNLKKYENL